MKKTIAQSKSVGAVFGVVLLYAAAAAAQPIQVDSADPPQAIQGTFALDVDIRGSGFDQQSGVNFLITGTNDDGGVVVNSVAFKGPKRLVANIDVPVEAQVESYDIEVFSGGRRGKGTELFAVQQGGGGNPQDIIIHGMLHNLAGHRIVSDGSPDPYVDIMPGTGNLVFQTDGSRTFTLLLMNDPETIENPCTDDNTQVCLRDDETPVAMTYDSGFLALNRLDDGLACDGTPSELFPRDMVTGECLRVLLSMSFNHPGINPTVKLRLRCGKHPNEGDQVRLECLDSGAEGCLMWDATPFLDGGGNEDLTCQLYHRARKGNEENLELAEYQMPFGMTIVRQD